MTSHDPEKVTVAKHMFNA